MSSAKGRAREYGAARRIPQCRRALSASPAIQSASAAAATRITHCPAAPAAAAIPPNASASTAKSAPSARRWAWAATARMMSFERVRDERVFPAVRQALGDSAIEGGPPPSESFEVKHLIER